LSRTVAPSKRPATRHPCACDGVGCGHGLPDSRIGSACSRGRRAAEGRLAHRVPRFTGAREIRPRWSLDTPAGEGPLEVALLPRAHRGERRGDGARERELGDGRCLALARSFRARVIIDTARASPPASSPGHGSAPPGPHAEGQRKQAYSLVRDVHPPNVAHARARSACRAGES
jgi:hypothetical protein